MSDWTPYDGASYLDFDAVEAFCRSLAAAHPEWVRLETLGHTLQERPLLLLTVTAQDGDRVEERPAIWADGATHATEWAGVMSLLYAVSRWIEALVEGDPATTRWFRAHAAHVLPVISADGYAHTHAGRPFVRSTLRPPRDGRPREGLEVFDIDGDGEVLWMRWRDPAGPYVVDAEHPTGFRLRTLDDDPEQACFVTMEARAVRWDGVRWRAASREHGLDLNRNFPGAWKPQSMFGMDAGVHPLSEPESRAVMDAVRARPRIGALLTMHTFTGALLTQPYRKDTPLGATDIRLMELMATDAVRDTDYRVVRVHPDFTYDPDRPIGGVWADTACTVFGVPAYTLELWDPYGFAGVEVDDYGAFFRKPDPAVIEGLFAAFCDEPDGWSPWRPFDHPQLGPVELGGLRRQRTLGNPPDRLLPAECERGRQVLDRLRRALPRVRVSVRTEALADDLVQIEAVVENLGYLPTGGLHYAEGIGAAPPIVVRLEGVQPIDGPADRDCGWLDGWGTQHAQGGVQRLMPGVAERGSRARVRWLARGDVAGASIRWDAGRGGAGVVGMPD